MSNIVQDDDIILLCGDFNSHTSTGVDYVEFDTVHDVENVENTEIDELLERSGASLRRENVDRRKDAYGQNLLNMCKNTNLLILNGRIGKDKSEGRATTSKNTAVDYYVGSPAVLSYVDDLYVENFDPMFSDIHNKVVLIIKKKTDYNKNNNEIDEDKQDKEVIGKWKSDKKEEYITKLDEEKINDLIQKINEEEGIDVESVNNSLKGILIDAARVTFSYTVKNKRKRKPLKFGYNKKCINMRNAYYKSKNVYRKSTTEDNLKTLRKASRLYKKEISMQQRLSKEEFIKSLNKDLKSTDPKQYWNILNNKNGKCNNRVDANVSSLYEYFKHLSKGQTPEETENIENSAPDPSNLDVQSLNMAVTEREIEKIVCRLKTGKAAGIDQVKNEYIKASTAKLMPIYVYIFNRVLDSGQIYPMTGA